MTISDLEKFAPEYPWRAALARAGLAASGPSGERTLIVTERSAFPKLAKVFAKTPLNVWRDYLTTRYMHTFAAELPQKVDAANFAFYGTVLSGNNAAARPRERAAFSCSTIPSARRSASSMCRSIPRPKPRPRRTPLVQNLLKAYDADIRTLSWMSERRGRRRSTSSTTSS